MMVEKAAAVDPAMVKKAKWAVARGIWHILAFICREDLFSMILKPREDRHAISRTHLKTEMALKRGHQITIENLCIMQSKPNSKPSVGATTHYKALTCIQTTRGFKQDSNSA